MSRNAQKPGTPFVGVSGFSFTSLERIVKDIRLMTTPDIVKQQLTVTVYLKRLENYELRENFRAYR